MRRAAVVFTATAALLGGCADIFPSSVSYVPLTARVDDPVQYQKDLDECHLIADGYRAGVNKGNLAQGAFSGAANNVAGTAISPFVPVLGAVGGAASSLVSGFGITRQDSITILVRCVLEETRRDHSAVVVDPH